MIVGKANLTGECIVRASGVVERIFASGTLWVAVRGSDLKEGERQRLPVWRRHVGDPILASNMPRRMDYALFMVEALKNDALIHEAPAIVGCQTPSGLAARARN